jgi:hypothetical protein
MKYRVDISSEYFYEIPSVYLEQIKLYEISSRYIEQMKYRDGI